MSRAKEEGIAGELGQELGLDFVDRKFKLDSWGQADNYAVLQGNVLVLLEVETNQKHPNTNVLKVWPYLEEHPQTTVILVQVFNAGAKNETSSRARLALWVAAKITTVVGNRFSYFRILCGPDGRLGGQLEELRQLIANAGQNSLV